MSLSLRSFLMNSNYLRIQPAAPLFPASGTADVSVKATGGMESTKSITMAKRGRNLHQWIGFAWKSTENHGFFTCFTCFLLPPPQKKSRADLFSPNFHWIVNPGGLRPRSFLQIVPSISGTAWWDAFFKLGLDSSISLVGRSAAICCNCREVGCN